MFELKNHYELHKNGELFFRSPFPVHGGLRIGLIPPKEEGADSGFSRIEAIVAGGECCHGFVMAVISQGNLKHAVEMDLNVEFLVPIVYEVPSRNKSGEKSVFIGLLVSGAGCDGRGIRFLKFRNLPESIVLVNGQEDRTWSYDAWFVRNPLEYPDIWERLERAGISVNRDKTEEAIKTWHVFRERHSEDGAG